MEAFASLACGIVGLLFIPLGLAITLELRRRSIDTQFRRAKKNLDERVERLVAEFPNEVAAWGGPGVLREPEAVDSLLRELDGGEPPAGLPSKVTRPTDEKHQRILLSSMMTRLERIHARIGWLTGGKNLVIMIPIGIVTTLVAIIAFAQLKHALAQTIGLISILACVAVFLLIESTLVLVWFWRRRLRNRAFAQLDECIAEINATFPDEVQKWGGPGVLRDAATVPELHLAIKH